MTTGSHSRPQEPRSPQGGATGGASREDGSTGRQGPMGVVQARRVINDPPGAHSAETIAVAVDVVEADLWGESPLSDVGRELDLAESVEEQQLAVFLTKSAEEQPLTLFKRADYQSGLGVMVLAAQRQAWDQIKAKDPEAMVSREEFRDDYAERIPGLCRKVANHLRVTVPQLHMLIFKCQLKWGDCYR